MNRWVKSFIFAVGCSIVMAMLMMVLGSPEVSEQIIPGHKPAHGFSGRTPDKVITTESYRNLPSMSLVMGGTFVGSFLIGITIFKTKGALT